MKKIRTLPLLLTLALGTTFTGCATTRPTTYTGIASAPKLAPNSNSDSTRVPFTYSNNTDWTRYSKIILEPVTIYRGPDQQFEKIEEKDKKVLALYLHDQVATEFRRSRYLLTTEADSRTLSIRITLTGAKATTKIVGTVLRFDLAGGSYNLVQAARGKEGAMTGSVSYAVEIHDASNGRLLYAYVAKQYPNAYNVKATLGTLDAAKVGIEKAAEDLLNRIN